MIRMKCIVVFAVIYVAMAAVLRKDDGEDKEEVEIVCTCSDIFVPVCGRDGQVYNNTCKVDDCSTVEVDPMLIFNYETETCEEREDSMY